MDKIEVGDKVINIKTKDIGIVVSGKISSHDHILWNDGSRSDLTNELEQHSVEKYKEFDEYSLQLREDLNEYNKLIIDGIK